MFLAFLFAFSLGINEKEMINVVIFLQGTFGSPDHSGCTLAQMVAKEGLVDVRAGKILVVATFGIFRATTLTFLRISDKGMDFNGIFPKAINIKVKTMDINHQEYLIISKLCEH